jgi:hypothetical protein
MGNKFNWDDEEDFRDIPDEVSGQSTPQPILPPSPRNTSPRPPLPQVEEPSYDYEVEEYQEEAEEDYSSVLSDARLRLEQGRLYEMIMNHDLFADTDADPKAIKTVQKQICNFAKEQMEIMLGMRREPSRDGEGFSMELPFNSLEVETLKALASAATKGATKSPDVEKYVAPVESQRSSKLNPIGSRAPQPRREQRRPLPSRSPEPVRRVQKVDPNVEARLRDGSYGVAVEQEYIEEAKRQLSLEQSRPLSKPLNKMSEEELKERNRQSSSRSRLAKSHSALAQPTPAQVEGMIMSRVSQGNASAGPGFQALLDVVVKHAAKK